MAILFLINSFVFVVLLPVSASSLLPKITSAEAGGVHQNVRTGESWLDRAPANWNRRMSLLPSPVTSLLNSRTKTRCDESIRQPESPAERALVRAGWMLYGAVQSFGLTKVVSAMSGFDGMCRPLGYQAFVYWEGRYAGTLSPAAMNSRTDGALINIRLVSQTRIIVEFVRYKNSDPLCCPSRISHVTYEVKRADFPIVAPVTINTWPVGTPSEGPDAENTSTGPAALFDKKWKLIEMDGTVLKTPKPYIEFDRQARRFTGDSGCNRLSGGFELDGMNLKFSRVISTRRACLNSEDQRIETTLLKNLELTNRFRIDGEKLMLSAGAGPLLTFKAW
jgi:heat shock protein HslJ